MRKKRLGFIGYGAIGSEAIRLVNENETAEVGAVLVQSLPRSEATEQAELDSLANKKNCVITNDFEEFLKSDIDLVVECAGQPSVRSYGETILKDGKDFLITSIGVLTDDEMYGVLKKTATENSSRIYLASGAMPAVDYMYSAALGGGNVEVTVTQGKPVKSWFGTPAEKEVDLHNLPNEVITTLFRGPAREAASMYPKNSNVSCMLALSTAGLDKTVVQLVTSPEMTEGQCQVEFKSAKVGTLKVEMTGKMSEKNPRTSAIVPLSVFKAIKNICDPVVLGA